MQKNIIDDYWKTGEMRSHEILLATLDGSEVALFLWVRQLVVSSHEGIIYL